MARKSPGSSEFQPDGAEPSGHPLFPQEAEDKDEPFVAFIQVTRFDQGGQMWCDRLFTAEELSDLSQIRDLYGGGHYELIARSPAVRDIRKPGNITARRRYKIPGRSLPLGTNTTQDEDAGHAVAAPVTAVGSGGAMGDSGLLIAILQMNQTAQANAQQQAQQQAQAQAEQSRQFMAMLMQFIAAGKTDSSAMTQMMMQMSQSQQTSMMQMVTAMMANRGGGPEEMQKYAELLKTLGMGRQDEKEEDSSSIGKMLEDAADTVQGLAQVLPMLKQVAPPANAGEPPPEGSAASVVAAAGKKG